MLKENDLLAWDNLYNKYASAMYGLICNLIDDKTIAEEIFIAAFIQLKEKQILSELRSGLSYTLLRYTYTYAIKQLKQYGISFKKLIPPEEAKLVHLFYIQSNSLKEAASMLNITEEETKKRLRHEFLQFRNKNNVLINA